MRPLQCAAFRRRSRRNKKQGTVTCEKPALHGFGCLLSDEQLAKHADVGLRRILTQEACKHAGRDPHGKWYFWTES